jgi:type IV pilus assembly protein PilA
MAGRLIPASLGLASLGSVSRGLASRGLASRGLQDESGFSLPELLVVLLIVGALAAFAIPSFLSQKGKAYDVSAKELVHTAQVAAEAYAADHGGEFKWGAEPAGVEGLKKYESSLTACPSTGEACLLHAEENEAGKGYKLVTEATGTGDQFTITLTNTGAITRTCTSSTTGCSGGATSSW